MIAVEVDAQDTQNKAGAVLKLTSVRLPNPLTQDGQSGICAVAGDVCAFFLTRFIDGIEMPRTRRGER